VVQELSSRGFANCFTLITVVRDTIIDGGDQEVGKEQLADIVTKVVSAIESLAEDKFFTKVQTTQSHIMHDARQDANEHLTDNPPGKDQKLKGRKAAEEYEGFIDGVVEQRIDSQLSTQTLKAALDSVLNNLHEKAVGSPDDLHIGMNYFRVVRAVRDDELFRHVEKTLGGRHGKIVRAILKQIDLSTSSATHRAFHKFSDIQAFSLATVEESLDVNETEHVALVRPHANGWHTDVELTNGMRRSNGHTGQEDISQSLRCIAEGPYSFLSEGEAGVWAIDAASLRKFLLRLEILKIARQRVGPAGLRLLRILIDKGRLDERVLQEVGLLSAKELRQTLGILHTMGFTDLQEVPRDPQRLPNRTTFLWFYDEARVQKSLLDGIYKTQARLYERMRDERDVMRITLEKVEKYHCEGHEDEYMSKAEATLLQQYLRKESWLLAEIARLDDSVALLSDL
jgi:transcription initiation factor IIE alpha subunit